MEGDMRRLIGVALRSVGVLATLAFAPGCGSLLADRCDTVCDCENCGDREREACEVGVEGDLEVADTYGCTEAIELYFECQLQEHSCEDGRYGDDDEGCAREAEDYRQCRENTSSRDRGPFGDPNFDR